MHKYKLIFLSFFTIILLSYCKKSSTSPSDTGEIIPPIDVVDVYVGGASNANLAAIWKNGEKIALSNTDATSSSVEAVMVKGGDVYAAGYYSKKNSPSNSIACYWKNGELKLIGDDIANSFATGIAINGNDIYVTGVSDNRAVFWKNGVISQLTALDSSPSSSANAIFIKDGNVYIAGNVSENFSWRACYWKNGSITKLSTGPSVAKGVTVNGTDVYVTGNDIENNIINNAAFWKNGVRTLLYSNVGISSSFGNYITIENNDVYIAGNITPLGQQNSIAVYWKNGIINNPINPGVFVSASAIAASGNNVYIVGFGKSPNSAILWKNNTQIELDKPGSIAKAIALVKR